MSNTVEAPVAVTASRAPQADFRQPPAEATARQASFDAGQAELGISRSEPGSDHGPPHPHLGAGQSERVTAESHFGASPAVLAAPEVQSGQTLPVRVHHWELLDLAAEGTWSRVYRARPADGGSQHEPRYAVKLLRPEYQSDPRAIALLHREAQVGRRVAHRHLVSVVGAELRRPPLLVAMPWLEGATLRQRLESGQQFDLPEALWIARQTAEALGALYQSGWLHGDVKPSNIMVAANGHVTLLDLGFARPIEQSGSIADRWIVGTCNYLAPEWFTSALAADIRSDIYSLGAVLFELLSGRLPYQGQTIGELAAAHRREAVPALRKLAPWVPAEVARLVHSMIAKDPLRRPQTPAELVDSLLRLEIELFTARTWA